MNTTAEQLFHLIEKGGSPYQVVEEAEKRLKEAGFEKLEFHTINRWKKLLYDPPWHNADRIYDP